MEIISYNHQHKVHKISPLQIFLVEILCHRVISYIKRKVHKINPLQIFLVEIVCHRVISYNQCKELISYNQRKEFKISPHKIFLVVLVWHKVIPYNQRKEHKITFNNQLKVDSIYNHNNKLPQFLEAYKLNNPLKMFKRLY